MKEYIKLFDVPEDADDYIISYIPFITSVYSTEQNLRCDEEYKLIVNNDDVLKIESALITFTIHAGADYEYTAVKGMIFEKWIDSEFNTDNYSIQDNKVGLYISSRNKFEKIYGVTKDTVIQNKEIYNRENMSAPF